MILKGRWWDRITLSLGLLTSMAFAASDLPTVGLIWDAVMPAVSGAAAPWEEEAGGSWEQGQEDCAESASL